MVYLLVYVDDIALTGNNPTSLTVLIQQLNQAFELEDPGPLLYFLLLQITRNSKGLFLNQTKCAHDLLLDHNMQSSKATHTPCPHLVLLFFVPKSWFLSIPWFWGGDERGRSEVQIRSCEDEEKKGDVTITTASNDLR